MTVTYTADCANGGKFVCFWRVLYRWRGSLYKLIWQDLTYYCFFFAMINLAYRYVLSPHMQFLMQKVKTYLSANISMFPVPFVLSFFVDQVANKWWHQYQLLPSPDTLAIYTNAAIPGKDEKSRMIRRTIVRYAILSLVLTMRNISLRVKKRFPTIKHVEEAGLILEEEKIQYNKLEGQVTADNWMPLVWAANIANTAKTLNKVSSDQCLRLLITELTAHRDKLGTLVSYDLVNIPLVYTQTMVVVVVSYVIITLFSNQPIMDDADHFIAGGFSISSLSDFIIFVGLMKVATVMLNPFGEDDDDFELNAIIDRHITAAYMIVDEMHEEEPEVVKDAYWDEIVPKELPYTVASVAYRKAEPSFYDNLNEQGYKFTRIRKSDMRREFLRDNKKHCGLKADNGNTNIEQNGASKSSLTSINEKPVVSKPSKVCPAIRELIKQENIELYDYGPNMDKSLQQPSTSKQCFTLKKRN